MSANGRPVAGEQCLRVAAVQLNATEDCAANLEQADRLTRAAAADGARLVLLPEKWSVLGTAEQLHAGAQTLAGEAISWARDLARELGVDLIAGSIAERRGDDYGPLANTSVHVAPDGALRAVYRKIHMFDVTVDGVAYRESDDERAGEEIVLSRSADGVALGMTICYDLRFPELYRILALRGARVMLVPAAFTLATTRDHWEVLLRARAIENQAFVVAANQIGSHPPGLRSGGRSMVVDPWGVVLAQAADAPCAITADLDLARLERIRAELPSLANRRPHAYSWPSSPPDSEALGESI
ncbi:MAG: carbon-nitrogen hydrolase family protein [Solirubrobacteraceae bacterium]|jgi:predicted amidohydrolase